jgi:hypothetical protein
MVGSVSYPAGDPQWDADFFGSFCNSGIAYTQERIGGSFFGGGVQPSIIQQLGFDYDSETIPGVDFSTDPAQLDRSFQIGNPYVTSVVSIPDWFLVLIFLIMPTMLILKRYLRRPKKNKGLCAVCEYDLRASPDRCPECGRARGDKA